MSTKSYSLTELPSVAEKILRNAESDVLCFYGAMGAGKTTLIKELVKELGGTEPGNSPTFGIVNEYHNSDGSLLGYHFDFYRLNDEMEALDLGLEDYLSQDAWIFIEWPEKIASLLPEQRTEITLQVLDPEHRSMDLNNLQANRFNKKN
ncbi:tRNA (adenosine(37)-N6)-threonylcarbamoyltransferase complex ATPase subunit type 1 TsaE [Zeaxanthinibacter enoshimensis]|uniref:tRNA threonylcarbamoyladenosine biosynthesis protein TsaE n=1 Tax=Zeaxanthinibacter enoshimensis TaxID=392009 RepID=A0A4R6TKU1_9FLAO|nr:tRNA (adenosine(37)-N6)-threonylcarbamoyltransferase complex ATPase subunit type 1 TsaE [Zeaxanthinibacter enoshimensis]TDQ31466.1 tRNA threonylcarbamoyladenosine biosynthesis protein TsaE [Zeaxanthinibacter enoshimensis]